MKFVPKPSLEHMVLVKTVISLWNQNDVKALISGLNSRNLHSSEKWKAIEERVIEKVSQFSLPQLLKEKVLGFVKPIGLEINEWVEFHCIRLHLCVNLPAELCWTPQGTVDRKKTAELLVRDDNLDISTRYKLACIYCMEDNVIQFWNSMPEDLKESVSCKFSIFIFWSHYRKRGIVANTHIDYEHEFCQSVICGNKVAAEYFLQKLIQTKRANSWVEAAKYAYKTDVLCFLISKMNERQQIKVFKIIPSRVLRCFLQWPWQNFFIGIANQMWDFLSKNDYENILDAIILKVENGYKDCNYRGLFREFWQKSPSALKSLITAEMDKGDVLPSLLRIKDKENITLILKDTTVTAKKKLLYSENGNTFCESFIRNNEWDFLEFFIRECLPSKNEMLKFKEEFEKHIMRPHFKGHFATKKQKWDELFGLSDDPIFIYDKTSSDEGESSSSK